MKILYSVPASGNGHIARAREILPYLKKYGTVDVFLCGCYYDLNLEETRYRNRGMSLFYNRSGGLNYLKSLVSVRPTGVIRQIFTLPVHRYDLVINDFEYITARACMLRKVPSVSFGHHASFRSTRIPRPEKKQWVGELVLNHFAPATCYTGLHFARYDDFIFTPVIKKAILQAEPQDKGHITIYLSSCSPDFLMKNLSDLPYRFEIFSRWIKNKTVNKQFSLFPPDNQTFAQSMINSSGVITGGGFETPAEALSLHKKLLIVPIRGQYEQQYNVAALEKLGVRCLKQIDEHFADIVCQWIETDHAVSVSYTNQIPEMLEYIMDTCLHIKKALPAYG